MGAGGEQECRHFKNSKRNQLEDIHTKELETGVQTRTYVATFILFTAHKGRNHSCVQGQMNGGININRILLKLKKG